MSNPYDSEGTLLKMADGIGVNGKAEAPDVDKDWTPDKLPPAMRESRMDDAPDFESFAATFGRASTGKGIDMGQATQEIVKPSRENGFHKDGSPRDLMESAEDCAEGWCSICR